MKKKGWSGGRKFSDNEKTAIQELVREVRKYCYQWNMPWEEAKEYALLFFRVRCTEADWVKTALSVFESVWNNPKRLEKPYSQIEVLERLIILYGPDHRHVIDSNRWLEWNGHSWVHDPKGRAIRSKIRNLVSRLRYNPPGFYSENHKRNYFQLCSNLETESGQKGLLTQAANSLELSVLEADLDNQPWILNTKSGPVDLRSGMLLRADRKLLLTKVAPHEFDPAARYPTWRKFLNTVTGNDYSKKQLLQQLAGYMLTGDNSLKYFFILDGPSDTGKSTFIETLRHVMGDYAAQTDFTTFLQTRNRGSIRNDLARLKGARMATATESAAKQKFDEPVIKAITGGDKISARYLYGEFFEFEPTFKIVLGTNHVPKMDYTNESLWRRVRRIRFDRQIPLDEQDPDLRRKLAEEAPGILKWAVNGAKLFYSEGWKDLGSGDDTEDLRRRTDECALFISDCCETEPDAWSPFSDLFDAWREWCAKNRIHSGSETAFAKNLERLGYKSHKKTVEGVQVRGRVGLKLAA